MATKLTFNVGKELEKKLRKLSKSTRFSVGYIINEILKVSFKNGIAKDLFWLYMKDHSDPFLNREITKGIDNTLLLKEAFSTIETVFGAQLNRIKDLEEKQTVIVKGLVNGKFKQFPLTDFIKELDT